MWKSAFRISMTIISGISTYFAFPFVCFFLVRRVFEGGFLHLIQWGSRLGTLFEFGIALSLLTPFICFLVFYLVYHALKYRAANRIQMTRKAQIIIALSAGLLTYVTFEGMTPILAYMRSLLPAGGFHIFSGTSGYLLMIGLGLNFFFFSTIVMLSLYYCARA